MVWGVWGGFIAGGSSSNRKIELWQLYKENYFMWPNKTMGLLVRSFVAYDSYMCFDFLYCYIVFGP